MRGRHRGDRGGSGLTADAAQRSGAARSASIAKALDRPPESLAARWGAVIQQVKELHHANCGMSWKTLANHKANAKAALVLVSR